MRNDVVLAVKAFLKYGPRGFSYLWMRYVVGPRILTHGPFDRPITVSDLSLHMLSGERDFLMALWSLASFYRVSAAIGKLYFHSDGTLTDVHKATIKKLFPSVTLVDARDTVATYQEFFNSHPELKEFRTSYKKFQSKKLLDPYLVSDKPLRLILDSDLLWFKNPVEIVDAVKTGVPHAMMMSDGKDGFVYVEYKDGTKIPESIAKLNSGVTLYRNEQFDLVRLESYLTKVDYMRTRFTDQACYGTILDPVTMLPMDRYIIKGTLTDNIVMRHYTSPQRLKFWFHGLIYNNLSRAILKEHVRD